MPDVHVDMSDASEEGSDISDEDRFTDFEEAASTFAEIVGKLTYVDKSLFIKKVLEGKRYNLITAPRRFGKSVNLDMLKSFIEIKVDPECRELQGKDKDNRPLFEKKLCNGEHLKIFDYKDICKKHLGQYPVIYADFKCDDAITSRDDAVKWFKKVIKSAYRDHQYLCKSKKLEVVEQQSCRKWCEDTQDLEDADITDGLKKLSEYLFKHFNKKVFILADEYDSVIMKALFNVKITQADRDWIIAKGKLGQDLVNAECQLKGDELKRITEFSNGILSAALKGNDQSNYVEWAVITGISHIAGLSGLNNVSSYPFLQESKFLDFYGLTKKEVQDLLERLENNKIELKMLKEHYNGYRYYGKNGKLYGKSLYPLWSILKCLDKQTVGQYFEGTGTVERLQEAFQIPNIRSAIQHLVSGISVTIHLKEKLSPEDLVALQSQFLHPELRKTLEPDIFLTFLYEQGYLTYGDAGPVEKNGDQIQRKANVAIPNKELKETFYDRLESHYLNICRLRKDLRDLCRSSFDRLINAAVKQDVKAEDLKTFVEILHKNLQSLMEVALSEGSCLKLNEDAFHTAVISVFLLTNYQYTTEYILENGRLDLAVAKDKIGIILEFKYDSGASQDTTAYHALRQIKICQYATLFEIKKFFPEPPQKIILMGISINNAKEMSLAYELNEEHHTVYIPEVEPPIKRSRRGSATSEIFD